jgi:hypothetical protein
MNSSTRNFTLLAVMLVLSACGTRFDTRDSAPPPDDSLTAPQQMSDAEIKRALSGKSWRWSSPKNSGVTLYAADGTSLVEVDGKGTTTGKWSVENGSLCESFAPADFMPKGMAKSCQPVSGGGNNFTIGQATFTLA